jgi:hypothetical protein
MIHHYWVIKKIVYGGGGVFRIGAHVGEFRVGVCGGSVGVCVGSVGVCGSSVGVCGDSGGSVGVCVDTMSENLYK